MIICMFLITVTSCILAIICNYRCNIYRRGFITLAKIAYNPKDKHDVENIMDKIKHELDRTKKSNY